MAKLITFNKFNTKSYKTVENAQKAVDKLESELIESGAIERQQLRFILTNCPHTGRLIPVIFQSSVPEHLLLAVAQAGFSVAG